MKNIIWVLVCLLLISMVSLVICICNNTTNYTQDYKMYNEVKDMTNTLELLDYCHTKGIRYAINDNLFEMENYDVDFLLNGNECMMKYNPHMYNISVLEAGGYGWVTVTTDKNDDGEIVKTHTYSVFTHEYTMCEGVYSVVTLWPTLIAFVCSVGFGIALYFTIQKRNALIRMKRANRNPNMD